MPIKNSTGKITIRNSEGSEQDLWDFILLNTPFEEGVAVESVEALAERFERLSENRIIFAVSGGSVVGYMAYSAWPNTEVADVKDYRISDASAEMLILNAMLMQAQKDAKECGVKHIQVVASPKEREIYEEMGFKKTELGTPGEMEKMLDA